MWEVSKGRRGCRPVGHAMCTHNCPCEGSQLLLEYGRAEVILSGFWHSNTFTSQKVQSEMPVKPEVQLGLKFVLGLKLWRGG